MAAQVYLRRPVALERILAREMDADDIDAPSSLCDFETNHGGDAAAVRGVEMIRARILCEQAMTTRKTPSLSVGGQEKLVDLIRQQSRPSEAMQDLRTRPRLPVRAEIDPAEREAQWLDYKNALQVIAQQFGTKVYCQPKNGYLRVDFDVTGMTQEQAHALGTIESLVELVSESPPGYLERLSPPDQAEERNWNQQNTQFLAEYGKVIDKEGLALDQYRTFGEGNNDDPFPG